MGTAPSVEAAEAAFREFDRDHGNHYRGAVEVWRRAWSDFIPFLDYPPELRRIVYTTNRIESLSYQLRKITKTRDISPTTGLP
ncbi:transposase-like protein [Actinopolyspora lacussalsi]|nr:transposase-like protein [Actinopolyspora lacussalsi]